ncbi:hypothetical protein MKEN_00850700 [Mycena kentingensis (nom. inval.)]|nr:hypothetical protein MKEN_00850700 [Mycena kentingensis (nom. inval.)]
MGSKLEAEDDRTVRDRLESLIQEGFEFDGAFAFSKQYGMRDAPNPCLTVGGIGTIGLPLGQRDAQDIIGAANPGTRAIAANKLGFDNPEWNVWLVDSVLRAATEALSLQGVGLLLRKLVIQDATSSPDVHRIKREGETQTYVGELVVILPSRFEGGSRQFRHQDQTEAFDVASQSAFSTTVVAAYSGTQQTVSPVTSGHCLAVVYDIVPVGSANVARLPEMNGTLARLRSTLQIWNEQVEAEEGEDPPFFACVLRHKYARGPTFSAKSLTGADALLLRQLSPLASELGFRLHLAHVDGVRVDSCEWERPQRLRGRRYGSCDWDDEDDDDVEHLPEDFVDVGDPQDAVNIVEVVDLEGVPVSVDELQLEWEDPEEVNEQFICGSIIDDEVDADDIRFKHTGTYSSEGERTWTWRRTALLIWPIDTDIDQSVEVGDVYAYAFHHLREALSATRAPTELEMRLLDGLNQRCRLSRIRLTRTLTDIGTANRQRSVTDEETNMLKALGLVRECADQWNDVGYFLRALEACGAEMNVDILGMEALVSAYQAFGWKNLVSFCNDAITHDTSSTRKSAFVACLGRTAAAEGDAELIQWVKAQEQRLLQVLADVKTEHVPWLVEATRSRGSEFFRSTLLPQLLAQNLRADFWLQLTSQLHGLNAPTLASCVDKCALALVSTLDAFPTKNVTSGLLGFEQQDKNSTETLQTIKLCLDVGLPLACNQIIVKMRDAAKKGQFARNFPPWMYYAELVLPVLRYVRAQPASAGGVPLDKVFRSFFTDAVTAMLAGEVIAPHGWVSACPLSDQHQTLVVEAAKQAGGLFFLQTLRSENFKGRDWDTIANFTRVVTLHFPRVDVNTHFLRSGYDETVTVLVRAAIDVFECPPPTQRPLHTVNRGRHEWIPPPAKLMELLQFCREMGMQGLYDHALTRFLAPPAHADLEKHFSLTISPLIPMLAEFLQEVGLDLRAQPFAGFAATVVRTYVEKFVGEQPAVPATLAGHVPVDEQIQGLGKCTCQDCEKMKEFLARGEYDNACVQAAPAWSEASREAVGAEQGVGR